MDETDTWSGSDDGTFVPFTDILFNVLLGLVFMVFTAFSLINPTAKTGIVDLKAELFITVTWPDNDPNDMDLYVEDSAGNIVSYAPEASLVHLDRDDRGNYRDTITVNGKQIQNPLNQETVTHARHRAGPNTSSTSTSLLLRRRTGSPFPSRSKN